MFDTTTSTEGRPKPPRCATQIRVKGSDALRNWALHAEPGEAVIYTFSPDASSVMRMAYDLFEDGLIALVQRREPNGSYAYIAQRTRQRVSR